MTPETYSPWVDLSPKKKSSVGIFKKLEIFPFKVKLLFVRRFIKWFWAVFDTKLVFSPVKHPKYLGGWLLDTIHSLILHLGQNASEFWPFLCAKTLFLTWKPIHKIYLQFYYTGNPLNLLSTLECEDIGAKMAKFNHPEMVLDILKHKIESIYIDFAHFLVTLTAPSFKHP